MATLESLARELRKRDTQDAERREAERAAKLEAEQKAAADARRAELIENQQAVRRGMWLNHLLATAPKDKPFDLLGAAVPTEPDAWPPGVSPENFSFVPKSKPAAEQPTSLHALLNNVGPK